MIYFYAQARCASCKSDDKITTGSVGIQVLFHFSEHWTNLRKVAVFKGSGRSVDVVLSGDSCTVPPEVLAAPGDALVIGVYGSMVSDEEVIVAIPTVYAEAGRIHRGAAPSGIDPDPPTPSLIDQLLEAAETAAEAAESAEAIAQGIRDDADSGAFDGEDGASAYELAVENGYTGTEAQWLQSLHGQDATVDATLSVAGEAADAAETGKVKELTDAVAERVYDYSNDIAAADITRLQGKTINSSNNLVDNENYSVLYLTAPASGRYKVESTSNSQLVMRVYSSESMGSSTYVKTGIPGYIGYTRYAELEAGQVLAIRAKSTTFTVSVSYATSSTVEMRQSLPLTETMEAQVKTWLNFPDELEMPICAAHRGIASSGQIGNTMPAYEDAVSRGWRYLECDLRKTSDDVWVLLHDATIATGVNIADITYTQALTYDLGGGTHIATLEELLALCRRTHCYPIVEIKYTSMSQADVEAVLALLGEYEMQNQFFLLCSSFGGVEKLLALNPYIPCIQTSAGDYNGAGADPEQWSRPYAADFQTGKNKVFHARLYSNIASGQVENFVDYYRHFGILAGVYGPTTQSGLTNLGDRMDLVISENYKYEIERDYGGGGGGGSVTVDSALSDSSENPVQNKVLKAALDTKADASGVPTKTSDLQNDSGFLTQHQSLAAYRTAAAQNIIDAGKADKVTEVTNTSTGDVTLQLDPGKIYHFTGAISSLTLTLATPASGQLAQYHFDFDSGSTAVTISISGVTWPGGSFTPEASTHYEVDILNSFGLYIGWEVTP